MAVASKFSSVFRRQNTEDTTPSVDMATTEEPKMETSVDGATAEKNQSADEQGSGIPPISEDLQQGVRDVAAITRTWSRWTLAAVFMKYVQIISLIGFEGMRLTSCAQTAFGSCTLSTRFKAMLSTT